MEFREITNKGETEMAPQPYHRDDIIAQALTHYLGFQLSQAGTMAKRQNLGHAESLLKSGLETLDVLKGYTN